jgi:hypothetical protein
MFGSSWKNIVIAGLSMFIFSFVVMGCSAHFGWGLSSWHRIPMNIAVYFAVLYFLNRKDNGVH